MTEVSLRSVSGKHCALKCPFSWQSFLDACEDELGFDRQTVKAKFDGRVRHIAQLAAAAADDDAAPVDVSKFSDRTPSVSAPIRPDAHAGAGAEGAAPCLHVPVVVFGRPRNVSTMCSTPHIQQKGAFASRPRNASIASCRHVIGGQPEFPGPLPFPHCPNGLHDLERIVTHGQQLPDVFPMDVYRHPTMQYIIRAAAGSIDYVRAVMEQVSLAAPPLFEWIQRNPIGFVRMLNRQEPSAQEQRTAALLQLVHQLSSEVAQGHREFTVEIDGDFPQTVELHVTFDPGAADSSSDDLFDSDSEDMYGDDGDNIDLNGQEGEGDYAMEDDDSTDGAIWIGEQGVQFVDTHDALLAALGLDVGSAVAAAAGQSSEITNDAPLATRGISLSDATTATSSIAPTTNDQGTDTSPAAAAVPNTQRGAAAHCPERAVRVRGDSGAQASSHATPAHDSATLEPAVTTALAVTTSTPNSNTTGNARSQPALEARAEDLEKRMAAVRQVPDWRAYDATLSTDSDTFSSELLAELEMCLSTHVTPSSTTAVPLSFLKAASQFFANLEEFYVAQAEKSHPSVAPPADPTRTLAGLACCAALAQQLVCECANLLNAAPGAQNNSTSNAASSGDMATPSRRRTTDGRLRVGALRNLPESGSVLLEPVLQWMTPSGPAALLRSLLTVVKEQPAAGLLWYTSHYFTKPEGKTVQTVAYVLDAGQIKLARLPFNSKGHKHDEVVEVLGRIQAATAPTASGPADVPETLRSEWGLLMKRMYKNMVKPIESYLPTPNSTANPLYVIDTRHAFSPRDPAKPRGDLSHRSQARWFGAYSDEKNMLCADKWCVTQSERPWNVVVAHEAPWAPVAKSEALALLVLGSPSTTAPFWLTEPLQSVYRFHQYAMSALPPTALHAVVLHESDCGLRVPMSRRRTSHVADKPIVADLRVVDECNPDSADCLITQRATICHNVSLSFDEEFYTLLYEKLTLYPSMPLGAAVRAVSLSLMVRHKAPWRVVEFSLMDYGGALTTLAPMFDAHALPRPQPSSVKDAVALPDAESRDYAKSHGVLNLFEAMLSHVMEERPPTTKAALDSLINYMESSKATLKEQVASATNCEGSATPADDPHRTSAPSHPPLTRGQVRSPQTPPERNGNTVAHRTFSRRQPK